MWSQPEPVRPAIAALAKAAVPPRGYAVRANLTIRGDYSAVTIERPPAGPPVTIFEALELPLPLVTRPRDFWYPQIAQRVRPERFPKQQRADLLVVYGPPAQPLATVRDSVAISDPRTGQYVGRAFWRIDRHGFWGAWSDDTETSGPCQTLAELTAVLNATKGIFAD